ncbi:hypothetical protein [Endozoicomonas sp. GU-1]|uniref:hypothetical protein n=1 Tax=Endozoicomonas sp. GU-1 TaxID=3009078 RepID=UPI0022B4D92C|nr:hypothetical protein [Endozoicomonas sp. GU-1]WBA88458.1 hypothetical protein O3276_10905 [Endozoicomonas sp. GU-1]
MTIEANIKNQDLTLIFPDFQFLPPILIWIKYDPDIFDLLSFLTPTFCGLLSLFLMGFYAFSGWVDNERKNACAIYVYVEKCSQRAQGWLLEVAVKANSLSS